MRLRASWTVGRYRSTYRECPSWSVRGGGVLYISFCNSCRQQIEPSEEQYGLST